MNLLTQIAVNRGFEYLAGYDFQNYAGRDAVLVGQQQTEHVNAFFGQIRTTPDLIPDTHIALGARYNIPSVRGIPRWCGMAAFSMIFPNLCMCGRTSAPHFDCRPPEELSPRQ